MKKIITLLCALLCILTLAGCSKNEETKPAGNNDTSEINTLGDAIMAGKDGDHFGYSITEDHIKVITDEYIYEASLTKELSDQLFELDNTAEDHDEQMAKLLADLPFETKVLRSESALTEEQMTSLVGKKGQELLDMGFENYGYNLSEENAVFFIDRNGYGYNVTVEEHFEDNDQFDDYEAFSQATIKEIAAQ